MLATVFKSLVKSSGLDPKLIDDIVVGNVLMRGCGGVIARAA